MASANIFSQYLRPPKSMREHGADMDAAESQRLGLESQREQSAMVRLTRGQQQQQMAQDAEDQNILQRIASGSASPEEFITGLRKSGRAGLLKQADASEKSMLDRRKIEADVGKVTADTEAQKYKTAHDQGMAVLNIMSGATDQASYEQGLASLRAMGLNPQAPPQFDPATVAAAQNQAMTAMQRLEAEARERGLDLTKRGQDITAATALAGQKRQSDDNAASRAQSERASLRADERSREANSAAMSKPFEVTGPEGTPILVQQDKQGNIVPVKGYGAKTAAEKPLNEGQSKAALFGARMEAAHKILQDLESSEGTTKGIPGARAGFGIGATINALSPASQQKLNQAKRDFVNAVLRRESGAVITDNEFANAEQQYFPQIGEGKDVIAQKKTAREIAIRGIQAEVPKASRGVIKEIQGTAAAKPDADIDALLKKYGK